MLVLQQPKDTSDNYLINLAYPLEHLAKQNIQNRFQDKINIKPETNSGFSAAPNQDAPAPNIPPTLQDDSASPEQAQIRLPSGCLSKLFRYICCYRNRVFAAPMHEAPNSGDNKHNNERQEGDRKEEAPVVTPASIN